MSRPSSPTQSRKRLARALDDDDYMSDDDDDGNNIVDTPSKRLRNPFGAPVARQSLHFNPHPLLNELAYTRLYITANFHNYHPATSPVLLCFLPDGSQEVEGWYYRALCEVLPHLYAVAPNLQALALALAPPTNKNRSDVSSVMDAHSLRILPVVEPGDLSEATACQVKDFRLSLLQMGEAVVLVDASGQGVWNSGELELDSTTSAASLPEVLYSALRHALQSTPGLAKRDDTNDAEMDQT